MIEVEHETYRPYTSFDLNRLVVQDRSQRREALLPIEKQLTGSRTVVILFYREIPSMHILIGHPRQDGTGRILAIQRVEEVDDLLCAPHIAALELGKSQCPFCELVNEILNRQVLLAHLDRSVRLAWRTA